LKKGVYSVHNKKLYGTATVGSKGQVVIPADARKELDITEGDRLYVVGSDKGQIIGLLKEQQLREIINKITGELETFSSLLEDKKE